ncbi:bactofilin family protein [Noviherbaspirillum galbum]|uniref:Polymer-forming cytoskeletal protein n=1 Tax=Noviherbaspirillum galbum TaxID=2709383 RepID=A0A6B3SL92_9BURK|nr:polymer-forming cytoskeletal protein [Noviherbaspirillum galbum]NEX61530.1 polymer-forming cytoskeletal protein [Noviherbaspirillum galbum]
MLRSENLFGKKDSNTPNSPLQTSSGIVPTGSATGLPKSVAPITGNTGAMGAAAPAADTSTSSTNEVGSKLIVGPNIKLKGVEITDCDTLVVEGRVEATIDSRVIQIADIGAFKGSAEIDIAEIRGEFDGDLTVRQKLVIYSTGKVTGKVRYGKLVIEEGGQLSGDIQVGTSAAANKGLTVAKVG